MLSLSKYSISILFPNITFPLIQFSSGDKYPQQLCVKCWNQCGRWFDFNILAQLSHRELKIRKIPTELFLEVNPVLLLSIASDSIKWLEDT